MSIFYYLYYKINNYFSKNKEEDKKEDKKEDKDNYFEKLL